MLVLNIQLIFLSKYFAECPVYQHCIHICLTTQNDCKNLISKKVIWIISSFNTRAVTMYCNLVCWWHMLTSTHCTFRFSMQYVQSWLMTNHWQSKQTASVQCLRNFIHDINNRPNYRYVNQQTNALYPYSHLLGILTANSKLYIIYSHLNKHNSNDAKTYSSTCLQTKSDEI